MWCDRKTRALKNLGPWRQLGLCRTEGAERELEEWLSLRPHRSLGASTGFTAASQAVARTKQGLILRCKWKFSRLSRKP